MCGLGIAAMLGLAAVKVAQPYAAAHRQAQRIEDLRLKIKHQRIGNEALRAKVDQLEKPAGTEAAARAEGWQRPDEVPAHVKSQPLKARPVNQDKGGNQ